MKFKIVEQPVVISEGEEEEHLDAAVPLVSKLK
jgi:hypothetical protein